MVHTQRFTRNDEHSRDDHYVGSITSHGYLHLLVVGLRRHRTLCVCPRSLGSDASSQSPPVAALRRSGRMEEEYMWRNVEGVHGAAVHVRKADTLQNTNVKEWAYGCK